jgi:membrane fusion protein (multidrug efflux system)
MPKRKKLIYIVTSVIVAIFLIAIIFRIVQNSAEASRKPAMVANVILGKVKVGDIEKTESLTGDIMPIQQASIFSKVSGNLEKIYVDIGDHVADKQLLALIDTTIYSQNAKQAHANFSQAKANLENTKLNYTRNKSLFSQNLIAQQDLDNSKTAYDVALAQEESAQASYTNALTQLGYCKVTAPFSGYITKRFLDPGAYVTSSTTAASSTLYTLMDVDKLKAMVNLPENDVPLLSQVSGVKVIADALPGKVFDAKLKKISEAVDLSTRTMTVEVDIENSGKLLKPGMFATIKLILGRKSNVLLLPNNIVLNDENGNYIFVLNPDSTVSRKNVKIGFQQNNQYEILSGVDSTDNIIFVGQSLIRNGSKVKIVKK